MIRIPSPVFRPRFSLVSVATMIVVAVFATLAMLRVQGAVGFAGNQGFPLAWYWWTDVIANDDPGYGYRWSGLVLDVVFWTCVIVAFGLLAERITQRFGNRSESQTPTDHRG